MLTTRTDDPAEPSDRTLVLEAARWVALCSERQPTGQEREELALWLDGDPRRAAALDAAMEAWERSPQLLGGLGYGAQSPTRRFEFPRLALVAGLSACCLLFFLLWPLTDANAPMLLEADAVERVVDLPDGSRVVLAPDSRATALVGDDARKVELLAGSAKFEVRSGSVPFIVEAGDMEVEVLGTVFSVDMADDQTDVVLHEGSIALKRRSRVVARMNAGEEVQLVREGSNLVRVIFGPAIASGAAIGANSNMSGTSGEPERARRSADLLVVDHERLDRLAAYLEAKGGLELQLANAQIGALRVSGDVDAVRPEQDLTRLIARHGLVLEKQNGGSWLITPAWRTPGPPSVSARYR